MGEGNSASQRRSALTVPVCAHAEPTACTTSSTCACDRDAGSPLPGLSGLCVCTWHRCTVVVVSTRGVACLCMQRGIGAPGTATHVWVWTIPHINCAFHISH
jgi:hypothetical protein